MGAHSQNQKRFRRSWNMRPHLFLLPLASLVSPLLCQLKFSGGVSSSSSNSNSNSPNRNTNNRPTDVDEKFFLGGDTPSLTGNQAFNNQNTGRCQCDYSLTFRDQNGNTHGACQRRDSNFQNQGFNNHT